MKKIILFTLITTLVFPLVGKTEEIILPVVSRPLLLQEGTQTTLTKEQIDALLPWAKNSLNSLNDLTSRVEGLVDTEKLELLLEGVTEVVKESNPKNSELLMRYVLSRAVAINDILNQEMKADETGTIDVKIKVLESSIEMAKKYYSSIGTEKSVMALFGLDYFHFLSEIDKSIFDSSAQYIVKKTAFEWLQWDLYRDAKNTTFASQIIKINNALKILPKYKLTYNETLIQIRQLKRLEEQLNIPEWIKTIPNATKEQISEFQNDGRVVNNGEVIFKKEIAHENSGARNNFVNGKFEISASGTTIRSGLDSVGNEYIMTIPIVETGDMNHPIDWDATIHIMNANTVERGIKVDGKTVQQTTSDGRAQYEGLGVQARKTINDYLEAVVRANYAYRGGGTTMSSRYTENTGQLFDPYSGVNVAAGLNIKMSKEAFPLIYGMSFSRNLRTGQTITNVTLGYRF